MRARAARSLAPAVVEQHEVIHVPRIAGRADLLDDDAIEATERHVGEPTVPSTTSWRNDATRPCGGRALGREGVRHACPSRGH